MTDPQPSHPFAASEAAEMLTAGLRFLRDEQGISLRSVASSMGFKQATSLSHMAVGRIPIPIDRAVELAERLRLDRAVFLGAVLGQRHPNVNWKTLLVGEASADDNRLANSCREIFGGALPQLTPDKIELLREVAQDRWPRERWLAVREVAGVNMLRRLRPDGLSSSDWQSIEDALTAS